MPIVFPDTSTWWDHNSFPNFKTYTYVKGGQYPAPDPFNIILPNGIVNSNPNYVDYKLHGMVPGYSYAGPQFGNTAKDLTDLNLDPASYTNKGFPTVFDGTIPIPDNPSIDLTENTFFSIVPIFRNLEDLEPGLYIQWYWFFISYTDLNVGSKNIWANEYIYRIRLEVEDDVLPANLLVNPYQNDLGFTLDAKEFIFKSFNKDTYLEIKATVKAYDFYTNLENEFFIHQKMVLFKNKGVLEFGSIVHRLMKQFDVDAAETYQYQWASFVLDITEKKNSDNTVIRQLTTNEINFIAGLSKGKSYGFLHFNSKPIRVTLLGYYFLNIFIPDNIEYEVQVFRNENSFGTIDLPLCQKKILSKKVEFLDFTPGDVVTYKLVEVDSQLILDEKKICVFPEGLNSFMILWEDEFLLKAALECTGEVFIKTNIESVSQRKYKNLVERIETIEIVEDNILSINTGWLMKSDIDSVISLIRSKRAWLITADQTIELRSITKSIVPQKTDQELISFDLDFKINKAHNAETYTL